jgi:hypothetical protein
MRKTAYLSTLTILLIFSLAALVAACGGTSGTSSTTVTTAAQSPTTSTGETTTTAGGETTTSVTETPTTTEAARTTDTANHASDIKAAYPSTESFNNSTWATVESDPGAHLGAAADLKGTASNVSVDPDSRYLNWDLTLTGTTNAGTQVLCRTNIPVDRSLLSAGGPVEVKGIVVGHGAFGGTGGAIIYVETVQAAQE